MRELPGIIERWLEPRSPLPLALLRIALGLFVLLSPEPQQAEHVARQVHTGAEALLLPPEGLHWFVPWLRAIAPAFESLNWLLRMTAVTTCLGLFTRASQATLCVSVFVLFGTAQLSGTVTHNMHLWWLLLLLVAGPADAGLSVDAWRKRRPLWQVAPSRHAALTLHFARLLLACVYLFPGVAKLRVSGLEWALGDNLQNQMHIKWYLAGRVPWPRIDHWPQLLHLGGIAVLAFELSFVVLIWFRGGRICAALAGLAFHFFAAYFMYIHFVGLWGCYVVLWDGPRSSQLPQRSTSRVGAWLALMAGTCLTVAVLTQGVRGQTQAWPFACYPDFAHRPARHVTDLAVEFETKDGSFRTWRPSRARSARDWGTIWRILGLYDGRVDRAALLAYARRGARQAHLEGALAHPPQVRIYSEDYSTAPEAYGDAPLRRRLLFTHHGF